MALTQAQLDTLSDYVTAGDRVGFYRQLADYGDRYGVLALGVVREATQAP